MPRGKWSDKMKAEMRKVLEQAFASNEDVFLAVVGDDDCGMCGGGSNSSRLWAAVTLVDRTVERLQAHGVPIAGVLEQIGHALTAIADGLEEAEAAEAEAAKPPSASGETRY